jgi:glycosyltransferase involved in cell wall biosynthesis
MPRVLHIVVTDAFAGVERYVCEVATETASRGWDVAVVGGNAEGMRAALGARVRWEPGATLVQSLRSVVRLGRWDVCHVQMTAAEAIGVATRRMHRAPIVTTRQFAARRGSSLLGRIGAPWIAAGLAREIAVSEFIARNLERVPAAVVVSGVSHPPCLWHTANRVVLVLQRLEPEKDTLTALAAWQASRLADDGWSLRVVGDGSQRRMLEGWVASQAIPAVTFTGWTADVADEMQRAGILLASAPAEPLGLSVIEAMAAGVPVVACAFGGHLETVGLVAGAPLFPPGDASAGGVALRSLVSDSRRALLSAEGRRVVAERFTVQRHVDRLLVQYEAARAGVVFHRNTDNVSEGLL